MSAYAGSFDRTYPVGRLNDLVYPVAGGMEDWAYAAGWDANLVQPCAPTTMGGYAPSRTDYATQGTTDAFRAFNMLVETSDDKRPSPSTLGTDDEVLVVDGNGDGHVPRNMRLALEVIDAVQPYVYVTALTVQARTGVLTAPGAAVRRAAASRSAAGVAAGGDRDNGGGGITSMFDQWIDVEVTDDAPVSEQVLFADLDGQWDVSGGYTVDNTVMRVGVWPGSVPPSVLQSSTPSSDPTAAAWQKYMAGLVDGSGAALNVSSDALFTGRNLTGYTRWLDSPLGRFDDAPFSSRFTDGVTVQVPVADILRQQDIAGLDNVCTLVVVVQASLDGGWRRQDVPVPSLPPQSHVVNARTNTGWRKQNNGFVVTGRTYFVSQVRASWWSCACARGWRCADDGCVLDHTGTVRQRCGGTALPAPHSVLH